MFSSLKWLAKVEIYTKFIEKLTVMVYNVFVKILGIIADSI